MADFHNRTTAHPSWKESADYTAIVSGEVTWPGGNIEIYVLPNPIIRRMTFSETRDTLDNVRKSNVMSSEFFVEAVAYQQVAIEEMERRAFSVQCTRSRTSARGSAWRRGISRWASSNFHVPDASSFLGNYSALAWRSTMRWTRLSISSGEGIAPQEIHYV